MKLGSINMRRKTGRQFNTRNGVRQDTGDGRRQKRTQGTTQGRKTQGKTRHGGRSKTGKHGGGARQDTGTEEDRETLNTEQKQKDAGNIKNNNKIKQKC